MWQAPIEGAGLPGAAQPGGDRGYHRPSNPRATLIGGPRRTADRAQALADISGQVAAQPQIAEAGARRAKPLLAGRAVGPAPPRARWRRASDPGQMQNLTALLRATLPPGIRAALRCARADHPRARYEGSITVHRRDDPAGHLYSNVLRIAHRCDSVQRRSPQLFIRSSSSTIRSHNPLTATVHPPAFAHSGSDGPPAKNSRVTCSPCCGTVNSGY